MSSTTASAPRPPERPLPDLAAGDLLARFLSGAGFAASGIGFSLRHPKVLGWALVPMLIQSVIFVAFVVAGATRLDELVERLGPEPGHWYSFLATLLFAGLAIALVLVGIVVTLLVGSVVCDPFYDIISETTEAIMLGHDVGEPFSIPRMISGVVRELGVTIVRLSVFLAVALPLWILGLTGVGSVVAAPLGLLWTWAFVALEGLSRSQARQALAARERLSVLKRQTGAALGFGALGWVLAFIPFTTPLLVVGGTRLFLALAAYDRVPSALSDADKARLRA